MPLRRAVLMLAVLSAVQFPATLAMAQTSTAPVAGQTAENPASAVMAALRMTETLEIMREEGLAYGETLRADMLNGGGGSGWTATVEGIYDLEQTRAAFEAALGEELAQRPGLIQPMLDFFTSDQGQRILTLELEARRALLDDAVSDAAKVNLQKMEEDRAPLLASLQRFVAAGDLVERNVAGALTSNLAFYEGMATGGRLGEDMGREDMMAMVWSQEPQIRADAEEWLMSYLAMAYSPLSPGDLDAYIAFSESEAGVALNSALFAAYDLALSRISGLLGEAVGRQMAGDDI